MFVPKTTEIWFWQTICSRLFALWAKQNALDNSFCIIFKSWGDAPKIEVNQQLERENWKGKTTEGCISIMGEAAEAELGNLEHKPLFVN